jgi:glycosyltransferase involved in cell wall biosynthesis
MNNKLSSLNLSIVTPIYGCPDSLNELCNRIVAAVKPLDIKWELLLVNDASPDNSWEIVQQLTKNNKNIIGIDLSRNFGQHAAITAGLSHAKGDCIVVMDCDLQDRPEEIPLLYNKYLKGFDVVLARRVDKKFGILKKFFSKLFYSLLGYLTDSTFDSTVANFGAYDKKVIKSILDMGDYVRCFPIFVNWVGFKSTHIDVVHAHRASGESAYTFKKSLKLAMDMMLSFSDKPLRLVIKLGFFMASVSAFTAFFLFICTIIGFFEVEGWASIVVSIWFLAGVSIFINGIIGLYVSKIFDQTKNRPLYIVREITTNKGVI